mgnify:FL=1
MVYNRVLKTVCVCKCIQYNIAICEYEPGNVFINSYIKILEYVPRIVVTGGRGGMGGVYGVIYAQ